MKLIFIIFSPPGGGSAFRLLFSFFFFLFSLNFGWAQSKGGRWQFENNSFDTADWDTQNNDGFLVGSGAYGSATPLQQGQYYLFLDTLFQYDYFRVEDNSDLDFTNENIGISAWIYPLELRNDVYFLVNKGRQDSNPKTTNYAVRISNSQHLEFLIRDANNQAQTVAGSFTIPVNQWTFIAIYYDFNMSTVYMWNDPSLPPLDTLAFNQSFFANDDPLSIGAWYQNNVTAPAVKEFQGRMDDVRISGRMEDIIPVYTSIRLLDLIRDKIEQVEVDLFPNPVYQSRGPVKLTVRTLESSRQQVSMQVYNILGQKIYAEVKTMFNNSATISWNLRDSKGYQTTPGIYFLRLKGNDYQVIKRLLILK